MGTVTLPNTLTAGAEAKASEVMANFNALVSEMNGNLDATNLINAAISTAKIADLAVTSGKLANSAVITGKIADDNVTAAKIADGAIDDAAKIADGIITAAKLVAGALGVRTGTYTGDGTAAHQIPAVATGFTVSWVLIMSQVLNDGGVRFTFSFNGMGTTATALVWNAWGAVDGGQVANGVIGFASGFFTVGSNAAVNQNGKTYFYIAGSNM